MKRKVLRQTGESRGGAMRGSSVVKEGMARGREEGKVQGKCKCKGKGKWEGKLRLR